MTLSPTERLATLQGAGPVSRDLVVGARDDDAVIGESELPERGTLTFEASNIRQERTGTHAKVCLRLEDCDLAYNTFNVERDEDRTRLANSAAKRLGDGKRWGEPIKLRLDQFCASMWEWWLADLGVSTLTGANASRPRFMLEPFILAGPRGTILYADPGAGKSWAAVLWAVGVSAGVLPWEHQQAEVLYLNLEDSEETMNHRVAQAGRVLGVEPRLHMMTRMGWSLTAIADSVSRAIDKYQPGLIILDSLSRVGLSLIADDDANKAMDILNRWGVPWLALAHSPKNGAKSVFGSVMWTAAAAITVQLSSSYSYTNQHLMGVQFTMRKANAVRKRPAQTWAFGFDPHTEELIEVRRAEPAEFPDLDIEGSPVQAIADVLIGYPAGRSSADISEESGISETTTRRILQTVDAKFHKVQEGGKGRGKKVLWGLRA